VVVTEAQILKQIGKLQIKINAVESARQNDEDCKQQGKRQWWESWNQNSIQIMQDQRQHL
jgi:hypothetical protein